jgi:hypothetical protein
MDEETFKREMLKAETLACGDGRQNYWLGYRRGLRRWFYGNAYSNDADHSTWMAMVNHPDATRREIGRGYWDGFNFGRASK